MNGGEWPVDVPRGTAADIPTRIADPTGEATSGIPLNVQEAYRKGHTLLTETVLRITGNLEKPENSTHLIPGSESGTWYDVTIPVTDDLKDAGLGPFLNRPLKVGIMELPANVVEDLKKSYQGGAGPSEANRILKETMASRYNEQRVGLVEFFGSPVYGVAAPTPETNFRMVVVAFDEKGKK